MDVAELVTFECDCCSATYTGAPHELPKLGWVKHPYTSRVAPRRGDILLCKECEAWFEPKWKAQRERKAA